MCYSRWQPIVSCHHLRPLLLLLRIHPALSNSLIALPVWYYWVYFWAVRCCGLERASISGQLDECEHCVQLLSRLRICGGFVDYSAVFAYSCFGQQSTHRLIASLLLYCKFSNDVFRRFSSIPTLFLKNNLISFSLPFILFGFVHRVTHDTSFSKKRLMVSSIGTIFGTIYDTNV